MDPFEVKEKRGGGFDFAGSRLGRFPFPELGGISSGGGSSPKDPEPEPCYALLLIDPKSGEAFVAVRPDGVKMGVPEYLDVVSISDAALARPGSSSTFPGVNLMSFYEQNIDEYYDPKITGGDSAYQHIGNFIYGYTGASYGISYDMLERQAGLRLSGADPTQQPTGIKGLTGGTPPFYGDEPIDGMTTAMGMGFFERGLRMEKIQVPCSEVGVRQ